MLILSCMREKITFAISILESVAGQKIEFVTNSICQRFLLSNNIGKDHSLLAGEEIQNLQLEEVTTECNLEQDEFISPIFTVPKKDTKVRLIINLKKLNTNVYNTHFKMEGIQTIIKLVTPNCWMASLGLKHAHYSVKVDPICQKYFSNSLIIHENFTQSIPFCHVNGLSNTCKTPHQTLVFDASTSSNTSVSFMLIKQSPSPTTAPDWFTAFHLRSHFKNSFSVFDHGVKTLVASPREIYCFLVF